MKPRLTIAVAVLVTALAALGAARIDAQVDFVDTVPGHPETQAYRNLRLGLDGTHFIVIHMPLDPASGYPSLRDPEAFDALVLDQEQLTLDLEAAFPDTFTHSLSAYEAMRQGNYLTYRLATGQRDEGQYRLPDEATWDAVRDRAVQEVDDVLAADGTSALWMGFIDRDVADARAVAGEVTRFVAQWDQSETTTGHQATGPIVAAHVTDERNRADMALWGPVAALFAGAALLWTIRRPGFVVAAVAGVAAATVWTFGIIGWMGIPISFLTVFLAPTIIGTSIDHGIHLLHRVQEGTSLRDALRATRRPILIAGSTTAAGLAILGLLPGPLFAQIGLVAALGVALGLVAAITVVPAIGALLPDRRPRRPLTSMVPRLAGHPVLVVVVVALTLLAAAAAATQTRVASGAADNEFPQDDPLILLQHRVEQEYGALQRGYIVIQGDMTHPDALAALDRAVQQAAGLPGAQGGASIVDLLRADQATDGPPALLLGATGNQGEAIPATSAEARQALDTLFDDPMWRTIAPFTISRDYSLAVAAIQFTPWDDEAELVDMAQALRQLATSIQADLGDDHDVHAAGAPVNRARIVEQTPSDLFLATVGVGSIVLVMLAAWWRRPRPVVAAALVVAVGVTWVLGAAATLDMVTGNAPLTNMFLLAFAVTIAAGVDDMVHLVERGRRGLAHQGRAVTGTTLTTIAAYLPLSAMYFLQSRNLAILTATGVLAVYLATIAVIPWAIRVRQDEAVLVGPQSPKRAPPND